MRRIGTIVLSSILVLLHQGKLVPYDCERTKCLMACIVTS